MIPPGRIRERDGRPAFPDARTARERVRGTRLYGGPVTKVEQLAPFVGRWRSYGRTVATPTASAVEIEGTDVYEWFPGGKFLVHHVDVVMGGVPVRVIEVIGDPDPAVGGALRMRSFDNDGGFAEMRATVDADGVWTLTDGVASRSTVVFGPDGQTMTARWERATHEGTWEPWMVMTFTRAS